MPVLNLIWRLVTSKYTATILRLFLGGLFIWASWDKIVHPAQFAEAVSNYKLLPDFAINLFAVILPWIEFVTGLFLIIGIQTKSSTFIILGLMFIFTLAVGISLVRGLDIECGCFETKGGRKIALNALIEDISFFILGLQVFFYDRGFLGIESLLARKKGDQF